MSDKKERYDAFAVPRNLGENGVSFNGLSRRNLVESGLLAASSGIHIVFYLPVDVSLKTILLCFVSLPLFFIGLVGFSGEILRQFLVTVIKFHCGGVNSAITPIPASRNPQRKKRWRG